MSHYTINITSDAPVHVQVRRSEEVQHPRDESGFRLSAKEVFLLGSIYPLYQAATSLESSHDVSLLKVGLIIGATATAGAAIVCSSTVRNGLIAAPGWAGRQLWKGCVGGKNFLARHGRAICGGIAAAGALGFNATRHTLGTVGKVGTAVVSTGAKVVGETAKGLGNMVEAIGNFVPEATGLGLLAGATYFGAQQWQ